MGSLEHVQEDGDSKSLLEFIRESGRPVPRFQEAVAALAPVFEGLHHGERPLYESLHRDSLRQLRPEVEEIAQWMSASGKADIKTRAIELMGALGYGSFVAPLERFLRSEVQWERLTAIGALGQITGKPAAELLAEAAEDPDPQIRAEARRVTAGRRKTDGATL
ncbi:MAG: HEAT repeat domain-containing protein [Candidatus Sulfotelmatobacter sp.]